MSGHVHEARNDTWEPETTSEWTALRFVSMAYDMSRISKDWSKLELPQLAGDVRTEEASVGALACSEKPTFLVV